MPASTPRLAAAGVIEFAGVHDAAPQTAARIAEKYGVPVFATLDSRSLGRGFQRRHSHRHAFCHRRPLLAAGKHVLVEKPMTDNAAQAAQLVQRPPKKMSFSRLAMSSGSIPCSITWRRWPPIRASSNRTAFPPSRRAARTSASCWT
jgi:hypothetical protein